MNAHPPSNRSTLNVVVVGVVVAVLLGIYGVGYLANLKIVSERYWQEPGPNGRTFGQREASYQFGGVMADRLFWPARRLDYWLRPAYWSPQPREGNIIELP